MRALLLLCLLSCAHGTVREVPLSPAPVKRSDGRADLLAGRLAIRPLRTTEERPLGHDLMDAAPSSYGMTRLFASVEGRTFVILATELLELVPEDFAATVSKSLTLGKYAAAPFPLEDSALRAVAFGPREPRFDGADPEAGFLLGVVVAQRDGTLQGLSFFANHTAIANRCADFGESPEGCMGIARANAATLVAGTRGLDLEGGRRRVANLQFDLPRGWAVMPQPGPDFVLVRLTPVRVAGANEAGVTLYLGSYPQGAGGKRERGPSLLGKETTWIAASGEGRTRTAIAEVSEWEKLEVTEWAQDASDLANLDAVVESIAIAP